MPQPRDPQSNIGDIGRTKRLLDMSVLVVGAGVIALVGLFSLLEGIRQLLDEQFNGAAVNFAFVVCAIVLLPLSFGYVPSQMRVAALQKARSLDRVIAGRTDFKAIAVLNELRTDAEGLQVRTSVALSYDTTHLSIWGGGRKPRLMLRIPWSSIISVATATERPLGRRLMMISIVFPDNKDLRLLLMSGRRVGWDILKPDAVEEIAIEMESKRQSCSPALE